jgi:hypothetical protein
MRWIAVLAAFLQILAWTSPVQAQPVTGQRMVVTTSWVEEWDPASQRWVRVGEPAQTIEGRPAIRNSWIRDSEAHVAVKAEATRFAVAPAKAAPRQALAQYGPFIVLDGQRAAITGSTDGTSPAQFDAMMRDFPGLRTLEMIEAPGTSNDIANLAIGRRIRAHGLATHVPSNGSVRSGAVELFLAGAERSVDEGAWFAVHSWIDNHGREPDDFAPDHPANRLYLDYYMEMGMTEERARAFYAMTNSVPHLSAKWLRADDMKAWIRPEPGKVITMPPPVSLPPMPRLLAPLSLPGLDAGPLLGYQDIASVILANLGGSDAKPFLDS